MGPTSASEQLLKCFETFYKLLLCFSLFFFTYLHRRRLGWQNLLEWNPAKFSAQWDLWWYSEVFLIVRGVSVFLVRPHCDRREHATGCCHGASLVGCFCWKCGHYKETSGVLCNSVFLAIFAVFLPKYNAVRFLHAFGKALRFYCLKDVWTCSAEKAR